MSGQQASNRVAETGSMPVSVAAGSAATVRYYHADQIGLPYELTSASGASAWKGGYAAWGTKLESAPTNAVSHALAVNDEAHQPMRFAGQYHDRETGLHYNVHRHFDPDIGRFTTPDPIGLKGDINIYRYAANPNQWIDPLGLQGGKLNIVHPSDPLWLFGEIYRGLPGCFTVIAHGMRNGQVVGPNLEQVSPSQLGGAIRGSPGYQNGMPVFLMACNSGKRDPARGESYGQRLSNELQSPVTAPSGPLQQSHGVVDGRLYATVLQSPETPLMEFQPQCRPRAATL